MEMKLLMHLSLLSSKNIFFSITNIQTMKKQLLLLTVLLTATVWLVTSCKKDEQPSNFEDIVDGATVNESSDVRINRVVYIDSVAVPFGGSPKDVSIAYDYNPRGRLTDISVNNSKFIQVGHPEGAVRFSGLQQSGQGWTSSQVFFNGSNIARVNVNTFNSLNPIVQPPISGTIQINRTSENLLQTIEPRTIPGIPGAEVFMPSSIRVLEFNPDGTPRLIAASAVGNVFYLQEVAYQQAPGVPNKLKRMLNEDILRVNKMGLINPDGHVFSGNLFNGKGNWLISFGLHRLHVLAESHPTLVASIKTTKIETINGVQTEVESNTQTFLYLHDVDNRNITINGLKVFYDVVRQR